jgi:DNA mismatch repair protein MutS
VPGKRLRNNENSKDPLESKASQATSDGLSEAVSATAGDISWSQDLSSNVSPMMKQLFSIKNQNPDCLIFFHVGDFYEMFYGDAIIASKILDLALTARDSGNGDRAPMCGVPTSALEQYLTKLVQHGYKVAIAEQLDDSKTVKNLIKREVVRTVTPGTVIDASALDQGKNNYIACIYQDKHGYGLAVADITTGVFFAASFDADANRKVLDEIDRLGPKEIIVNEMYADLKHVFSLFGVKPQVYVNSAFNSANAFAKLTEHFRSLNLSGFGLSANDREVNAAGALLAYLADTQKNDLKHITSLKKYEDTKFLSLDINSRRNLELVDSLGKSGKKYTLLNVLDCTKTPMGGRMLRQWLTQPLTDPVEINRRLDAVQSFANAELAREELRGMLGTVRDIERLLSRVIYKTANARDMISLKLSFQYLVDIWNLLPNFPCHLINEIAENFDPLSDMYDDINRAIMDEPPVSIREGGFIKDGFSSELDNLRAAKASGGKWLSDFEKKEREISGIRKLKIVYNRVFGYGLEVSNTNTAPIPAHYIRKQTLSNCERYITDELKKIEDTILNADDKIKALEYELFTELREKMEREVTRIQLTAAMLAAVDTLSCLADTACRRGYVRPSIDNSGVIDIKDGRHPVVECFGSAFIPNDTRLDSDEYCMAIITGPNMAGKSTYIRQIALIVLMAQAGSFVPSSSAKIGCVDKIFTRVGASDDISAGQSTFMSEMVEVANILNNASEHSLLILDEMGRGTGTYDGLSIAWATIEYISQNIGAKTLFATHYHELTELEGKVPGVKNYRADVLEQGDKILFLRKIAKGGADHSYGIQVAKLAGLPTGLLDRAKVIMDELSSVDIARKAETRDIVSRHAEKKRRKVAHCEDQIVLTDLLR